MQLIEKVEELKIHAIEIMKKFKCHAPMYFLKIADVDNIIVHTPEINDQETKINTVADIRKLIANGKLEEYVFICEGTVRDATNSENKNGMKKSDDCLIVLYASPKKEIQYICKCDFLDEDIKFSPWEEYKSSDSSGTKQGLFNNLFDKENCIYN